VTSMGLNPVPVGGTDWNKTIKTVNFVRGGTSNFGSRDEVLNTIPAYNVIPVGPNPGQQQRFSYFYQDDAPAPGTPPQFRTDGESDPKGYAHKLGDVFHSEPLLLEPPRFFQYLSANLSPNGKAYSTFAGLHTKRRRVVFVGANDGFVHGFDAGVWGRDTVNFPSTHDLGTGREIFGYALTSLMKNNFPNLLRYPPAVQYFMDGSFGTADVFIDTSFAITPNNLNRDWKSVLVGTTRQGGKFVYALDVTYPDAIDTNIVNPTYGEMVTAKDNSPACLDGGGAGCPTPYPQVLWELTDDCSVQPTTCALPTYAKMGETWSRPVVGRIKILNGGTPEDRYVAVFGGGDDPTFNPLDTVLDADQLVAPFKKATRGREFYIVDVETGRFLYKAVSGKDGGGTTFKFAPMTAPPALVDFNDDGYIDLAYIGDINGQMWRIDLSADATAVPPRGDLVGGVLTGYQPFLLFKTDTAVSPKPNQPIFLEPGIIYLAGGPRPTLGVAFGTGNRRELAQPNTFVNRFYFVVDGNQSTTATEVNLRNITPPGPPGPGPSSSGCATAPCTGFFLDYGSANEKATSSVYSTQGYLTLITFTPDANNPCSTEGSSYRYRFFFLNGQGGYNLSAPQNNYTDYRQSLGTGLSSGSQSTSPNGNTIDTVLFSGGAVTQQNTAGSLNTINVNWKEQQ
jgi:type IV pilus assembly protein PilY1